MENNRKQPVYRYMLLRSVWSSLTLLIVFFFFFIFTLANLENHNTASQRKNQTERMNQAVVVLEEQLHQMEMDQLRIINSETLSHFLYFYDSLDWYTRYDLQLQMYRMLASLKDQYSFAINSNLMLPTLSKTITNAQADLDYDPGQADFDNRMTLRQGKTFLTAYRRDGAQDIAVLFVELDLGEILKNWDYLRDSEMDEIRLLHTVEADPDARPTISVAFSVYPLILEYYEGDSATDTYVSQIRNYSIIFALLCLGVVLLGIVLWDRQVYNPLHTLLIEAFGRMEMGDLQYRIPVSGNSFLQPIYLSYNHMMDTMEQYVERDLKQKILIGRASLKQLQSQINPHFMYNSYYILYRLIRKRDMEGSLLMAEYLGKFYHYITRNADDEKHLREEVDHAQTYAAIQCFRFRDSLEVRIDPPPPEIAEVYVPRLILQPVLENAFKYVYEIGDGSLMQLMIRYRILNDQTFEILIENSGAIDDETLRSIQEKLDCTEDEIETTALVNIHRRLKIYYGPDSGLRVSRSELGGLQVCLHIERREP